MYSHKPKDLEDYQFEMEILIKKWLCNYEVISRAFSRSASYRLSSHSHLQLL